jgi:molybdopterin converting factor small subunit
MQLKLLYGRQELFDQLAAAGRPTVRQAIEAVAISHPQIYQQLCDGSGNLRASLAVFVNGEHIRYRNGWDTVMEAGDEIYIVPLITGG